MQKYFHEADECAAQIIHFLVSYSCLSKKGKFQETDTFSILHCKTYNVL